MQAGKTIATLFEQEPALGAARDPFLWREMKISLAGYAYPDSEERSVSMQHIRIRACTLDDIDAVMALERHWEQEAIAYGDFTPLSRDNYLAILESFPAYFLVAERAGQLVGYIHGSVQRDRPLEVIPAHQPYVEIEDLYVLPEFRNQEIGGTLLERLFEVAGQEGIGRFAVSTLSKQTEQILRFYRSHGFTPWFIQFFR